MSPVRSLAAPRSDTDSARRKRAGPGGPPEVKAISSECRTILDPHFRAAVGSLLRPAGGQLRNHRQTVGKERSDIRRRSHEASRAPRSSDNGLPREPAADVAEERLPDFRRDYV